MNLRGTSLEEWICNIPTKQFPSKGRVNYYNRYQSIKEYLDNEVHPLITSSTLTFDEGIYLTKHGTEHIEVVIEKLSKLVDTDLDDVQLSPYEVYILLVATQFHDTGHIKTGRINHEKLSADIITNVGNLLGNETAEKRAIFRIAEAHGGRNSKGKKDKIEDLLPVEDILGQKIRPQMLASLLRLADELADDTTRASRILMTPGIDLKGSEVFHYYASVLQPTVLNHQGGEIALHYILEKKHLATQYKKTTEKGIVYTFLIDEIYERLFKMYLECTYCMRFIPYRVRFHIITAKISFIESDTYLEFHDPIAIRIHEKGYPQLKVQDLYDLCPESLISNGYKLDGKFYNKTFSHV